MTAGSPLSSRLRTPWLQTSTLGLELLPQGALPRGGNCGEDIDLRGLRGSLEDLIPSRQGRQTYSLGSGWTQGPDSGGLP